MDNLLFIATFSGKNQIAVLNILRDSLMFNYCYKSLERVSIRNTRYQFLVLGNDDDDHLYFLFFFILMEIDLFCRTNHYHSFFISHIHHTRTYFYRYHILKSRVFSFAIINWSFQILNWNISSGLLFG